MLAVLFVILGAGCAMNDFEERFQVTKPRILALQMDPPEIGPSEEVSFTLHVASPDAVEFSVRWTLCLLAGGPAEGYACRPIPEVAPLDRIELGEGRALQWTNPLDADDFEAICAQAESTGLIDCAAGLPLDLIAEMWLGPETSGEPDLVALRRTRLLGSELAARSDRNRNPELATLLIDDELLTMEVEVVLPLRSGDDDDAWYELLLPVDEASAQQWEDPEGGESRQEQLRSSWFSTAGEFERSRGFFGPRAPMSELQGNRLRFNEDFPARSGDRVQIWVVLRDDRGGVAIIERTFRVE